MSRIEEDFLREVFICIQLFQELYTRKYKIVQFSDIMIQVKFSKIILIKAKNTIPYTDFESENRLK